MEPKIKKEFSYGKEYELDYVRLYIQKIFEYKADEEIYFSITNDGKIFGKGTIELTDLEELIEKSKTYFKL
jgi:hypothetical protein